METKLLEQKENPVMERKEIRFLISYEQAPPKRTDTITMVSEAAKTKPEFTIIKKMKNVFGSRKIVGLAHAYENENTARTFETKNVLKRNNFGQKEEKPAEAAAEEKPAQEAPKEEAEEKKEGEA